MAIGTATAILGGTLLAGAYGANRAAGAASDAADKQVAAGDRSNALQKEIYDQNRLDQTPWREAGVNALGRMQGFAAPENFSFTADDFNNNRDPGYAFRMSEGLKALDRSASARGGLLSGAALKGITRYGQEAASQEYGNAYNRALTGYNANRGAQDTQYNRLASMAGLGQTAMGQTQNAAQNYATNVGNTFQGQGNAMAASTVGGANAITGGISSGINAMNSYAMMNQLNNSSGYSGGGSILNPTGANLYGGQTFGTSGWGTP